MATPRSRRRIHAGVVALALLPLLALAAGAARGTLGANPVETVTHETGHWALRLLLASLLVTPLRRGLGWPGLAPYRRTLGLLGFAYATLHLATYVALDLGLSPQALAQDVRERPFVAAGFAAWLSLLPLALTSTRGMQRRLGRRWRTLHRLAYLAPALAVLHYLWLVKADLRGPLAYAGLLAGILAFRLLPSRRRPRGPTRENP